MATMILTLLAYLAVLSAAENITSRILNAATADHIDLFSVPNATEALASIEAIYAHDRIPIPAGIASGNKFDVHVHVVPPFYRALGLATGFLTVPWSLETHLDFMAGAGIKYSVVSIGAPGSQVWPGSEAKSVALARLLNEYMAALAFKYPDILSFWAVAPLPYTTAAITESTHALKTLNASGTNLYSNHEGSYLGAAHFTPFFAHLNNSVSLPKNNSNSTSPSPIFVHPNFPCLRTPNGSLIPANPTAYTPGLVEFYFETARTFMDLTVSQTALNFSALHWLVPHGGGAFPAILDRFSLATLEPEVVEASKKAFGERFWWDSAWGAFPRLVQGILGHGVPETQLVYGSDYPYAPNFTFRYGIEAIENVSFLTEGEKEDLFWGNGRAIFGLD